MADLRGEVADIAIGAAESVVERSLDRDAQLQLIEDYINQVGLGHRPTWSGLIMATERDDAYATAMLAVARAEGDLGHGRRTSCSASPGRSTATTSSPRR